MRQRWSRNRWWWTFLWILAAGCGSARTESLGSANASGADVPPAGSITVLAAASLSESFGAVVAAFETAYPNVGVRLSHGASSSLAAQIVQGSPADVFASADIASMERVRAAGLTADAPVAFATNTLQIIVARGNPKAIRSVADLARKDVLVVTAAPTTPIGNYTKQVVEKAGVVVTPKSLENDVLGVVTKVTLGEADAGVVYATDVRAGEGKAQGVEIPEADNTRASYPIASLATTKNRAAADAFVRFVTSANGRGILAGYGFGPP